MNRQKQERGQGVFAVFCLLGLLTGPQALAQRKEDDEDRQTRQTLEQATASAEATRIAHERYRFLKRLEKKFGFFPVWIMTGKEDVDALFPIGRADRVYLFFWSVFWPDDGEQHDQIFCYQRKVGKDRLVYRIVLKEVDRPAKKLTRLNSLLDFVHASINSGGSYAFGSRLSKFAKTDLGLRRDYAFYTYYPTIATLVAGTLSDVKLGRVIPYTYTSYFLEEDPFTKAELKRGAFYQKYGLPMSSKELMLLGL